MKVSVTRKEFKNFLEGIDNETLLKHIYLRAVNKNNHEEEVISFPTAIDDIVLEAYLSTTIEADDDEYLIGMAATKDILNVIKEGMPMPELYFTALENTRRDNVLVTIDELYEKKFGRDQALFNPSLYKCFTTMNMQFGAVHAFFPDTLKDIADKVGDDLYITFPSIHEFICHPVEATLSGGITKKDLYEILRETIAEATMDNDILSRSVFHYDRTKHMLTEVYKG